VNSAILSPFYNSLFDDQLKYSAWSSTKLCSWLQRVEYDCVHRITDPSGLVFNEPDLDDPGQDNLVLSLFKNGTEDSPSLLLQLLPRHLIKTCFMNNISEFDKRKRNVDFDIYGYCYIYFFVESFSGPHMYLMFML
jgi:hypothetical protein